MDYQTLFDKGLTALQQARQLEAENRANYSKDNEKQIEQLKYRALLGMRSGYQQYVTQYGDNTDQAFLMRSYLADVLYETTGLELNPTHQKPEQDLKKRLPLLVRHHVECLEILRKRISDLTQDVAPDATLIAEAQLHIGRTRKLLKRDSEMMQEYGLETFEFFPNGTRLYGKADFVEAITLLQQEAQPLVPLAQLIAAEASYEIYEELSMQDASSTKIRDAYYQWKKFAQQASGNLEDYTAAQLIRLGTTLKSLALETEHHGLTYAGSPDILQESILEESIQLQKQVVQIHQRLYGPSHPRRLKEERYLISLLRRI